MVTNNNEKMQELTVEEKLQNNCMNYKESTPRSIKSRLYGENYR